MNEIEKNPLFAQGELPDFENIDAAQVVPAVDEAIRLGLEELHALEKLTAPTWQNFVLPLRQITKRIDRVWGVVNHLMGVKNSDALRKAHEAAQAKLIPFRLRLAQSPQIFYLWKKLSEKKEEMAVPARKRIIEAALRDAVLSGVALEGEARKRFNAIEEELAKLSTSFSNSVLDATKAFKHLVTNKEDIVGLPPSWRSLARSAASEHTKQAANAEDGPWLVTLDYPSLGPFLQHAKNRTLREEVYRANIQRASGQGFSTAWNNWPVIEKILKLRQETAVLLGYKNFAAVSLASKMAPNLEAVYSMLDALYAKAQPAAVMDFQNLKDFAEKQGFEGNLMPWDVAYYAERRREALFDFTDEQTKPYFPLERVLQGLFALAETLFGVQVAETQSRPPVWQSDVRFYEVFSQGKKIAAFYLDPYARAHEKRGGAWMDVCRQGEKDGSSVVLPVAYLVCNGTPPVLNAEDSGKEEIPSLMAFREVETLFHEFGHGLQHMLTQVAEYEASGIANVEWDAVELPSQFMENWVYEKSVVDKISGHWQTGETLPAELFEKIVAAKNYMSATQLLRQLYFSMLDLTLHTENATGESAHDVQARLAKKYTVLPPLKEDAFLCSFGHIFAGGYAAGYYSYKWAEVLSADAFAAFEEAGLSNKTAIQAIGKKYRDTILSEGGSRHPLEVYRAFRGRDATIDALIRHSGL